MLESHFVTPFLVDVAVLATCGVTLRCGHCQALWWPCARAVQAITDRQPFAINGIEEALATPVDAHRRRPSRFRPGPGGRGGRPVAVGGSGPPQTGAAIR